ncbi:hypothetical protein [Azonexus sp. IMCC34839]|uniref:hypothetical protein n=1 Tax=Azonexus sp. IMCC34839 TaxID=3133695 RepID=UPI00399B723D
MNKSRILAFAVSLALAACAFGYQARGNLSDVPGELRGKGYPANTQGGGRFTLSDRSGALQCDGVAYPPDVVGNSGCEGESGKGEVRCSDGREFAIRWQGRSCRSWVGEGEDARGNRLTFRVERLSR